MTTLRHRLVPASDPDAPESCSITPDDSERRRPDMEFGDDVMVVLALGVHLPDAANYRTVERTHLSPEQQLDATLIFFRHGGLPVFSR